VRAKRLFLILLILLVPSTLPLGAQQTDGSAQGRAAPRLAGIVDLGSLLQLWGDSTDPTGGPGGDFPGDLSGAAPEPLDITTTPDGPVLLFSDRILSLGLNLEITRRTVQDLTALPRLPREVVPARLLLNPLHEPIIYDARTGSLDLLHRDGSDPERFQTEFPQAVEAGSLRRGGVVLSDGKRLSLFSRKANGLTRLEILLPAAFTTGLSIDGEDRLWVYDLAARKVRVFDPGGEELFAVTPDISGGNLLFPQVFLARPDGGFFLGTAGELWCFDADGSVRWRLSQFNAGFRQALPAFYRLAAGRGETGCRCFYILDPLGNRILKFIEDLPDGSQGEPGIEAVLAAAFQSSETRQSGQNEVVRLCLERQLYLQAAFFRRSSGDEPLVTDLAERIRAKQARLLAELAEELENELRYAEAESAFNHSLSLYRELRSLDPVDPRYPEAIRELSERRNALRQIRVAEKLLTARLVEGGLEAGDGNGRIAIALTNSSGSTLEQVEVLARFSGYGTSRWQASAGPIRAGGRVLLAITFSESGTAANREDLSIPCNLLVRYLYNRKSAAEHFRLPLLFPAGTLRLPAYE
jgi:tetratricopeptide (TPR) repeat protein